jgi:hypothetical protein
MEKNWVRFPRIRPPQQDDVRLFDLAVGTCAASCSEYRRQTGDARRMSSSVAAIDVVGTHDAANEFLRGIVQLVGRFGAAEHAKVPRIVLGDGFAKGIGHAVHGLIPGCRTMRAVLTYQRLSKALFRWIRHITPEIKT